MALALWLVTVAIVVTAAVIVSRRVLYARQETRRVRALFSRYVSPLVVDEILARADPRLFEGKAGYATILYCRIWNFAHFAEDLSPQETVRYLNEFYTLAGKSIQKHRGMIDKFLGDGIIGVFGMPLDDPFKEEHAIKAALDIIRLVAGMDARWTAQGRKPFKVGIGINSGDVIAGDTGFLDRREFTVIGNEAIVASRLQEVTEGLNAYILITEGTYEAVRDTFSVVPASSVPLRGMRRLARAYIVRGLARHAQEDALLLPQPGAFRKTALKEPTPAVDAVSADAPPPGPPRPESGRPAASSTGLDERSTAIGPPPPVRELAAPRVEPPSREFTTPFELPELRAPRLRTFDDDHPAMPEPPPPRLTYEDKDGPPLQLPP